MSFLTSIFYEIVMENLITLTTNFKKERTEIEAERERAREWMKVWLLPVASKPFNILC